MQIFGFILLLLLVGLSSPMPVRAETTVYFMGHAVSVAPPVVLLVCGLALITIGTWIRKWFVSRQGPEPEPDDVFLPGPASKLSSVIVGPRVADAEHAEQNRPDWSEIDVRGRAPE